MFRRHWLFVILFLASVCTLNACSGGAVTSQLPSTPPSNGLGTLEVRILVPPTTLAASSTRRLPQYFSPATQSVVITAVGPSPATTESTAYVNVSGSNPACTGYQATTCKVSLTLGKSGTYALTFLAYDATQKSSTGPFVGRPLETNETSYKYSGTAASTYTVSLDGIPAYFTASPNGNGLLQGSRSGLTLFGSSEQQLLLAALDRDGNPIIGPGSPVLSLKSSSTGILTATAVGSSNPNLFVLQAKTSGSPAAVTPGVVQLTAQASQPSTSGAGSATLTIPIRVSHSLVAVATQSGNVYGFFDSQTTPKTLFKTSLSPHAIAFDRFGNIFLGAESDPTSTSSTSDREIDEYPKYDQSTPTLKLTDLNNYGTPPLNAVVVDSAGDIYAATGADPMNNDDANASLFIFKAGANSASYAPQGCASCFTTALAIGANDTLYTLDEYNQDCHQFCTTPSESVSNTSCCSSGYQDIESIAVDTAGDVRISRVSDGALEKWPSGTGAMISKISIGSGNVAIDLADTLYNASGSTIDVYPGAALPKSSSLTLSGETVAAIAVFPNSAMRF